MGRRVLTLRTLLVCRLSASGCPVDPAPPAWGNRPTCLLPVVSHETARRGQALALPRDRRARPRAAAQGRMGFRTCRGPGGGKASSGRGASPASLGFFSGLRGLMAAPPPHHFWWPGRLSWGRPEPRPSRRTGAAGAPATREKAPRVSMPPTHTARRAWRERALNTGARGAR